MHTSKKKTAGGTIVAIASLLFVFSAGVASAASESFLLYSDGTAVFNVASIDPTSGWARSTLNIYDGASPGGSVVGGNVVGSDNSQNRLKMFENVGCTTVGTTATCDLEALLGTYGDGDYYFRFFAPNNSTPTVDVSWYNLTRAGGNWSSSNATPFEVETRLLDLEVSGNATTTNFKVDYFLKTAEFNNSNRPDTVAVTVVTAESTQVNLVKKLILPLTDGNASTTLAMSGDIDGDPLPDGDYSAYANFYNFASGNFTFTKSSIVANFTISGGTVTSSEIVQMSDGLLGDSQNPYVEAPCGITAIGGCIQNAFAALFYPSDEAIDSFTSSYDTLATKFPFAYFTDFNDSIASIYTNPDSNLSTLSVPFGPFGDITLISKAQLEDQPLSSTIRTILNALIWILLGATIYRRTQKIFNTNQT